GLVLSRGACPEPRGGNATALQTRWRTTKSATSKDSSAEEPHCAKGCAPSQFIRCPRGNKSRAAQRTERGAAAADRHCRRVEGNQPVDSICRLYSIPWSSRQRSCARLTGVKSSDRRAKMRTTTWQQATVRRQSTMNT